MVNTFIIILFLIIIILQVLPNSITNQITETLDVHPQSARFRVTFRTLWGTDKIDVSHPEEPHTGNMFLVVHNHKYNLWALNDLASTGIRDASQFGTIDLLKREAEKDSNILAFYTHPVLRAPGSATFEITADTNFPLISFATMVAPSPDWFTGTNSFNLMPEGRWTNRAVRQLYVFDAGTDYGMGFYNKPDYPEPVPKPISVARHKILFPDTHPKPIADLFVERLR